MVQPAWNNPGPQKLPVGRIQVRILNTLHELVKGVFLYNFLEFWLACAGDRDARTPGEPGGRGWSGGGQVPPIIY